VVFHFNIPGYCDSNRICSGQQQDENAVHRPPEVNNGQTEFEG